MSPPHRARVLAPAVALLVAFVVFGAIGACGDDGDDGDATTTSTSTTASPSTTTTEPEGSTSTTDTGVDHGDEEEGLGELEALVPQLLVAASELGPDVEDIGFRPLDDVDCGVDGDHPADVLAGTGLQAPTQVIEEVIRVYPTPEAAEAAFEAWLDFPAGCTFGLGVPMDAPADANDLVGADRSVVYQAARDGDATTTLVVALVSDSLVTTAVTGTPGMDPVEVGAFAVGKIQAALES